MGDDRVEIVHLAGVRLDPACGLLRRWTRAEALRDADYTDNYDRRTLVYDCFWHPVRRAHVFVAPPFLNLWRPFRRGLSHDGQPARGARRRFYTRSEQVVLPGAAGALAVGLGGATYEVPVRAWQAPRFAGLDCIFTMNKDNDLDWIRAWAAHHIARHGAEGVVIFDNGSTAYGLEELAATLRGVPGLKAGLVYAVPFPYGPRRSRIGRLERGAKFLQSATLNLARVDALARARGVLNVDIDEVVAGPAGISIFEAARAHWLGLVSFDGEWIYPAPGAAWPAPQAAHSHRVTPRNSCSTKWCVVPGRGFGRGLQWDVHRIGGGLQHLLARDDRFERLHCRACSTGWKAGRMQPPTGALRHDPGLEAVFDAGPVAGRLDRAV
ncbi:MAG: hypothetical protein AAFP13_05395 [Pseudomonadota bacterium]